MWWLTVSNATDMSSKMRTKEAAQGTLCLSIIENRAISVEWPLLKTDWFGLRRRRRSLDWNSVICFKNASRNGRRETRR